MGHSLQNSGKFPKAGMGETCIARKPLNMIPLFFSGFFACIFLLHGCASQVPPFSASLYTFTFGGESFRIRSVYSENESDRQNELIGSKFLAVDFDQDRIIDFILVGQANMDEAQRIYDYGLDEIAKKSKLTILTSHINRYVQEDGDYQFEIKSFRPERLPPFNEFIVVDKRQMVSPATAVAMDRDADGTLDEILKGPAGVEKFQSRYQEVIETGLRKGKLVRINETILVLEK
jgi:hypothetical protein